MTENPIIAKWKLQFTTTFGPFQVGDTVYIKTRQLYDIESIYLKCEIFAFDEHYKGLADGEHSLNVLLAVKSTIPSRLLEGDTDLAFHPSTIDTLNTADATRLIDMYGRDTRIVWVHPIQLETTNDKTLFELHDELKKQML